jgi:hypothetical protein
VRSMPEWQEFVARGAFKDAPKAGGEFSSWLADAHEQHKGLMSKAQFALRVEAGSLDRVAQPDNRVGGGWGSLEGVAPCQVAW